ncbi:MAG: hypothetical protein GY765_11035 [bacterium]|nr:hypothetical protein [bacterium]
MSDEQLATANIQACLKVLGDLLESLPPRDKNWQALEPKLENARKAYLHMVNLLGAGADEQTSVDFCPRKFFAL